MMVNLSDESRFIPNWKMDDETQWYFIDQDHITNGEIEWKFSCNKVVLQAK